MRQLWDKRYEEICNCKEAREKHLNALVALVRERKITARQAFADCFYNGALYAEFLSKLNPEQYKKALEDMRLLAVEEARPKTWWEKAREWFPCCRRKKQQ